MITVSLAKTSYSEASQPSTTAAIMMMVMMMMMTCDDDDDDYDDEQRSDTHRLLETRARQAGIRSGGCRGLCKILMAHDRWVLENRTSRTLPRGSGNLAQKVLSHISRILTNCRGGGGRGGGGLSRYGYTAV